MSEESVAHGLPQTLAAGAPAEVLFRAIAMKCLAVYLCLACAAACGGDAGSAGVAGGSFSCSVGSIGIDAGAGSAVVCVEGAGATAKDYDNSKQRCLTQGSSFADSPCSRVNALGACRIQQGAATITTWYYGPSSFGIDVQQICKGLGVQYVTP